jgi:hypothetical protein
MDLVPTPTWWAVDAAGVKVRAERHVASVVLHAKYGDGNGNKVLGVLEGDWLRLVDEPGYIMVGSRLTPCTAPEGVDDVLEACASGELTTERTQTQRSESTSVSSSVPESSSSERRPQLPAPGQETPPLGRLDHHVIFPTDTSGSTSNERSSRVSNSSGSNHLDSVNKSTAEHRERSVDSDMSDEEDEEELAGEGNTTMDELGDLPSAGSALHSSGKCKPCIFMPTCHHGKDCKFCHYSDHVEGHAKTKIRPCKGKRDQYKSLIKRNFEEIERSPETFDPEHVQLPSSVDFNPRVKQKFINRLMKHKEKCGKVAKAGSAPRDSNASSSSAPRRHSNPPSGRPRDCSGTSARFQQILHAEESSAAASRRKNIISL